MAMPRDVVMLSDEQFNKLVELLTPGYELAKAYMASSRPPEQTEEPPAVDADERTTSMGDPSQAGGA